MKQKFLAFLLALTILLSAFPVALAEDETIPVAIGNGLKNYQIVSADGLDVNNLTLNQIPYEPQFNPKGDIILRTGDLLCANEARRLVDTGDIEPSQFLIQNGNLLAQGEVFVTMTDINELLALLEKYSISNIPGGARLDLKLLIASLRSAQDSQATQEEVDAKYISALKGFLSSYNLILARRDEKYPERNENLAAMGADANLNLLLDRIKNNIDKGIYHGYDPTPAAAFGIQGNWYVLASGAGTTIKKLVVNKVWPAPMTPGNGYPCPGCGNVNCACVPLPPSGESAVRSDNATQGGVDNPGTDDVDVPFPN